ncbi:hypothetical protein RJ639_011027 [Escallonia herrerae]|uniref:Uncharacterized protein n=1 Tax=Escallonia herrerae TaxID=1293975 RepID=A0AA89AT45_9ASTE|nr:hypothetical protein RJ639_011027 [Escallonia herrerae]
METVAVAFRVVVVVVVDVMAVALRRGCGILVYGGAVVAFKVVLGVVVNAIAVAVRRGYGGGEILVQRGCGGAWNVVVDDGMLDAKSSRNQNSPRSSSLISNSGSEGYAYEAYPETMHYIRIRQKFKLTGLVFLSQMITGESVSSTLNYAITSTVFEYFASIKSPTGEIFMTPADLMRAVVPVLPPSEANCVRDGYLKGESVPGELRCAPSKYF